MIKNIITCKEEYTHLWKKKFTCENKDFTCEKKESWKNYMYRIISSLIRKNIFTWEKKINFIREKKILHLWK